MKFFVSGKIGEERDAIEVMSVLRIAGHEITFDWTVGDHLKPYDENAEACCEAAIVDSQGVKAADVLIILPHERGIGMYVELGIAISSGVPVRVVTDVKSLPRFFHHPLVKKVGSVEEILKEFSIGVQNETKAR